MLSLSVSVPSAEEGVGSSSLPVPSAEDVVDVCVFCAL